MTTHYHNIYYIKSLAAPPPCYWTDRDWNFYDIVSIIIVPFNLLLVYVSFSSSGHYTKDGCLMASDLMTNGWHGDGCKNCNQQVDCFAELKRGEQSIWWQVLVGSRINWNYTLAGQWLGSPPTRDVDRLESFRRTMVDLRYILVFLQDEFGGGWFSV